MRSPEYIDNSGALGVLAMAMQSFMGGRMERKANERASEFAERVFAERSRQDAARQQADYERQLRLVEDRLKIEAKYREPEQPKYALVEKDGRHYYVPEQPTQAPPGPQSAGPSGGASQVLENATQDATGGFDVLRDAVEFHESRGNPNAVSPKGAVGRM